MLRSIVIVVLVFTGLTACSQSTNIPNAEIQVRSALLAAPADKRDSATVFGYNNKSELVTLREGTNEIICVADDPAAKGFSVSSYHKDLQPFMQRGRDLRKNGK